MGFIVFMIIVGFFLIIVGLIEPITIGMIIFGIILGGIGVVLLIAVNRERDGMNIIHDTARKEKVFQEWLSEKFGEYSISKDDLKYLYTADKYYIFKPDLGKFIFINYRGIYYHKNKTVVDKFNEYEIDFTKVKKVALKTNDQVIGEVTKENAVGRALVGGVLFGGAGAIVGSASAKQTQVQTNEIINIKLEVITTDVNNPYSTILLYDRSDSPSTNFEQMEHSIQNLYWSLENSLQPA